MSDDTGWVKAANRTDLAEGEVLGVLVAGKEIALYDLDGEVHATDDIKTYPTRIAGDEIQIKLG